jgi:hypothetical protein
MSLTNGQDLYAALDEEGLQKFLRAVYLARPHYFAYATASMGGGTTDVSLVSPIPIPGTPTGFDFSLELSEPDVEFFPLANPAGFPLPVGQNQFALHTQVTIDAAGGLNVISQKAWQLTGGTRGISAISASVDVYAVGQPSTQVNGQETMLTLSIVDIQVNGAGNLGALLAAIGQQVLNALLANLQIPVSSISLGTFDLQLKQGPEITENQLKIWAAIV